MDKSRSQNKNRRSVKGLCIALTVIFVAMLVITAFVFLVSPKKEMSESENRVLAKAPTLSFASIKDGSFMNDFETWLSDQFPGRDRLIAFKTKTDILTGKKEENGVYIGKKGFLFEKQTEYDEAQVKKLTDSINKFAKKNKSIKTSVLISPNSSCVLSSYMPRGIRQEDQSQQLETIGKKLKNVSWVDCVKTFSSVEDKKTLFYRTDHHWTTDAAYLAYGDLIKTWKFKTKGKDCEFFTVSNSFKGTLASSSGVNTSSDEIKICVPKKSSLATVVDFESSSKKSSTVFQSEKLNQKNQYEVFLGGNYDKVVISTNVDTDKQLLVFKDSYANCMIPMLTQYFSKIVMIDPRYFSGKLSDVLKEYDFTHAAFIYNLNTFLGDTSLYELDF